MKMNKLSLLLVLLTSQLAFAANFTVSSQSLIEGASIAPENYWNNFGCSGKNMMPDLTWSNIPEGTKSFVVTLYDHDAPTGSGFWHWVAYNIPAHIHHLPGGVNGGVLPEGIIQSNTDLSKPGFFGPCPPVGRQHHYVYTVHALKVDKLTLDTNASPALVGFNVWQNSLGKAELNFVAGPRR